MNIQLKHEGTDITNHTISYSRTNQLCTGVGMLEVVLANSYTASINPGDELLLWENEIKAGTYQIGQVIYDIHGEYTLVSQDGSKRLKDYFISDIIAADGLSTKYWMQQVFDMALVDYNFNISGDGFILSPHDSLGAESAYEAIIRFCQQNSWYFYFDADDTCQIGQLSTKWSNPDATIKESDGLILFQKLDKNDRMLRNRAIIWGGSGVYVTVDRTTPWDRGSNDIRSIVLGNSYIRDYGTANDMAKKLLDEFSKTVAVKTYEMAGPLEINVGDTIFCQTTVYNGAGLVTTINVIMEQGGFKTNLTLDERCPRLFSYWSLLGDTEYVYVGTANHGIYRKLFSDTSWSNYSDGISDLRISDLKINNGVLLCTTASNEAYTRNIIDSLWTQVTPSSFLIASGEGIEEISTSSFITRGCSIDSYTGNQYIGYFDTTTSGSWVMSNVPTQLNSQTWTKLIVSGNEVIEVLDIDHNGKYIIATANTTSGDSVIQLILNGLSGYAYSEISDLANEFNSYAVDPQTVTTGSEYEESNATYIRYYSLGSSTSHAGIIWESKLYIAYNTGFIVYDFTDNSQSSFLFSPSISSPSYVREVYTADGNIFYIVNDNKLYTHNKTSGITTEVDSSISSATLESTTINRVMYKNKYYFLEQYDATNRQYTLYQYDVTTQATSSVTTLDLLESGYSTIAGREETLVLTDTGCFIVVATVQTGVGVYPTGFFSIAGINHTGSTSKASQSFYTWEYDDFLTATVSSVKPASDNRLGDVVVFCGGYFAQGSSPQFRTYFSSLLLMPQGTLITTRDYDWTFGDTFSGGGWFNYNNVPGSYPTFTHSFFPVAVRGELYSKVIDNGILYLRDLLDPDLKTDIDSYFTNSAESTITIADDYDDTLLTADGSNNIVCIDKYGNEVKKYNLAVGITDNDGLRFPLHTGHIITADYENRIKIYTISGVAMPPAIGGIQALSTGAVTTSGDTFGIIGSFTTTYPEGTIVIDISRESPIIFYGGVLDTELGTPEMAIAYNGGLEDSLVTIADTATPADQILISEMGFYPDARYSEIIGLLPTTSGVSYSGITQSGFLLTTVGSGSDGGMYFKEVGLPSSNWQLYTYLPGKVEHLETTNYLFATPRIFLSTSGAPATFWQTNPGSLDFYSASTGLPSSNITVIRTEDRL